MTEAIIKGASTLAATEEELELINRYTRRKLQADEVYIFSLILCDNEIDRDYECFSTDALYKLKELFLGKTGIFDHDTKGRNQSARVFETIVGTDNARKTKTGEPYCFLKAKAYMVRSEKNKDLMLEIDAGIKKEVSVGCSVAHSICSICGRDKKDGCEHLPGKQYKGKLCYRILSDPIDAYEFSFVAVPAQRSAGVIKQYYKKDDIEELELFKKLGDGDDVSLSGKEAEKIQGYLEYLQKKAEDGSLYRKELCQEIMRLSVTANLPFPKELLERITGEMETIELKKLRDKLKEKEGVGVLQLNIGDCSKEEKKNTAFQI